MTRKKHHALQRKKKKGKIKTEIQKKSRNTKEISLLSLEITEWISQKNYSIFLYFLFFFYQKNSFSRSKKKSSTCSQQEIVVSFSSGYSRETIRC
jgi:hypothetical protein